MSLLAQILIALVAALHVAFLILEMVYWTKPIGRRIFNLTPEFAEKSKALAANQGLYNGFLGAGLLWALNPLGASESANAIATFFLICVIIAGCFGAMTVSKRILIVQALPALITLIAVWVA